MSMQQGLKELHLKGNLRLSKEIVSLRKIKIGRSKDLA